METIIDALKAMGKASSIEIAARLDMDRSEVVSSLWELKRAGETEQEGKLWKLVEHVAEGVKSAAADVKSTVAPEIVQPAAPAATRITADDLIKHIAAHGSMTAPELAVAFNTTTRKIASTLAMATSKGRVRRTQDGGNWYYTATGKTAEQPKSATKSSRIDSDTKAVICDSARAENAVAGEPPALKSISDAEFVESIPVLTPRAGQMVIPAAATVAREIRRTRVRLAQLEKVRAAISVLRNHRATLARLVEPEKVEHG